MFFQPCITLTDLYVPTNSQGYKYFEKIFLKYIKMHKNVKT